MEMDPNAKLGTLVTGERGEEKVRVVEQAGWDVIPWRFSTDLPRALIMFVIAGVSYLL